jgi:hypothetical protein
MNSGTGSSGFGINSGSGSSGFGINSGSGSSGGSMFGSPSSGGFSGGTSPLGGSGYSGGFSGGNSSGVSRSNPFASYYTNPLQPGVSGGNGRAAFGTPLYGNTTTTNTGAGTLGNRAAGTGFGAGGSGAGGSAIGNGSTSARAPRYSAGIDLVPPRPIAAGVGRAPADVVQILARSPVLGSERNIQASMDGGVLVLKGTVANEYDRRLAEGMVRLSPGVYDVRNELRVIETLPVPQTEH